MSSYWTRILQRRIARRRAVFGAGMGAFSAALLAACGGSDDEPEPRRTPVSGAPGLEEMPGDFGGFGTPGATTGSRPVFNPALLATPEDTTGTAVRGGTYRYYVTADIPSFDPHALSFANAYQVLLNYNRLLRIQPGRFQRSAGIVEGDLAESWEFSPDNLTLALRLRPNAGMPDLAPVNGRMLNAQDVVFSWERWKALGSGRSDLVNEVNPNAPILSLAAPDARTVLITLQQPMSSLTASLANQASGSFFILPVEAQDRDPSSGPIGGGPYYRSQYEPSARVAFRRNENHYEANLLFPDAIEMPVVSDRATGLSQLKAGNLHHYNVAAEDLMPTKRDVPALDLYRSDFEPISVDQFFGFQPGDGTPFRDVRLRQAWSMMMDRDLYLNTFSNRANFEAEGVPVETAWNTAVLSTQYAGWWLDPKGPGFGENARFYQHNVAEANALVQAAGFTEDVTVEAHMIAGSEYGATYHRNTEALQGMAGDPAGPFRLRIKTHAYATDWFEPIRDSKGYFNGVGFRLTPYALDPGEHLYALYNTGGALYYGFDAQGTGTPPGEPFTGDPTAQELTNALRTEFAHEARIGLAHQLQQHLAQQQYFITHLGSATGFDLVWPAVKNWLVHWSSDHARRVSGYWLDPTRPPGR